MTTRRPRTVIIVAVGLLAVLLGLFAYASISASTQERRDAEARFSDRSDFIDSGGAGGTMEYAAGFKARDGGTRIVMSGFSGLVIGGFIGQYLAQIPDSTSSHAFVVDSKGFVVGSPVRGQAVGKPVLEPGLVDALAGTSRKGKFDSDGTERAYTVARVANSTWSVVLTTPTSALYSGNSALVEWLILLALAIAGVAAVLLLGRAVAAAEQVRVANARLEGTNADLERSNLERRIGDQMPRDAIDCLRRMRSWGSRMSTLIEDLLRFSRMTTHARPPTTFDLGRVAREVTSDLDALLEETRGTVDIGPLPHVQADPLQDAPADAELDRARSRLRGASTRGRRSPSSCRSTRRAAACRRSASRGRPCMPEPVTIPLADDEDERLMTRGTLRDARLHNESAAP